MMLRGARARTNARSKDRTRYSTTTQSNRLNPCCLEPKSAKAKKGKKKAKKKVAKKKKKVAKKKVVDKKAQAQQMLNFFQKP